MKNSPQSALSDFKQKMVILFTVLQAMLMLVLVITHVVQTEVITGEIYSVLFQRILIVLLELIRLLWF